MSTMRRAGRSVTSTRRLIGMTLCDVDPGGATPETMKAVWEMHL